MSQPLKAPKARPVVVGDRVVVKTNHGLKHGAIMYVGQLHVAKGVWIGIEMDEKVGKHNGTLEDHFYFAARPDHGLFSRQENIRLLPPPSPRVGSGLVEILAAEEISLEDVRAHVFVHGVPDFQVSRALCWKLLLGYMPPERASWPSELVRNRGLYVQFVSELITNPYASPLFDQSSPSLSSSSSSPSSATVSTTSSSPPSVSTASVPSSDSSSSPCDPTTATTTTIVDAAATSSSPPLASESLSNSNLVSVSANSPPSPTSLTMSDPPSVLSSSLPDSPSSSLALSSSTETVLSASSPSKPLSAVTVHVASPSDGVPSDPLSTNPEWTNYFKDQGLRVDIDKDVARTHSGLHFFQQFTPATAHSAKPEKHAEALARILFIFAKLNPGIRYVQGMNEILAPIYFVFAKDKDCEYAEADAFFCFSLVMSELRDRFTNALDNSAIGIMAAVDAMSSQLQAVDFQLSQHLRGLGVDPRFYAFRWITLLLSQEFELPDVIRLWDALFADPNRFSFITHCCVALVVNVRSSLLASDFAQCITTLQNYPPVDVTVILSLAQQIKSQLEATPQSQLQTKATQVLHDIQDASARASNAFSKFTKNLKTSLEKEIGNHLSPVERGAEI